MINRLQQYCFRWNLVLNKDKSKIMVFRKGGRLSRNEKWYYGEDPIQIVNEYKYLGVTFTPTLSLSKHFSSKLTSARYGINSLWRKFIGSEDVPLSTKWQVFETVSRTTITYAGQVWGYQRREDVECFNRFFMKRMFGLPQNTPNYILYLESGRDIMWLQTLKMHFKYILKALALPDHRYPKILTSLVVQSNSGWCSEWKQLFNQFNEGWVDPITQPDRWGMTCDNIIDKIRRNVLGTWWEKASNSQFHQIYYTLRTDNAVMKDYLNDSNKRRMINIIFRARGSLLPLNFRVDRGENSYICSLCNSQEIEDIYHFIGKCKVLSEYRVKCS
ncbi:uncharacterized protein LOC120355768 isoform X2 [Nilaparvata lugens]|uniref:uncharacterized protein LOC120355768 isoform X1 n=1 Tax=Nilaparvata lugens TaxID=108931 RepID=UPI00193D6166|nr:uncharacterized protein LOC120355768 isoform X1 [Nilaparvata lugens]XP_039300386.1 uncharacterized protein LOC120355768 isoform X2 [Nilaparvata lugens]